MNNKVEVGVLSNFPLGSITQLDIADLEIALAHTEEGLFAIDDVCSHAEVSLSDGSINGCLIECPMHGAEFDLKTGEAKSLPATKALSVYKVLVNGDDENATVSIEVGK